MKFAAIDIGSNAVRLLLGRFFDGDGAPFFKKESLVRIPLRLGTDAFTQKRISEERTQKLISTVTGFRYLIDAYQPVDYLACATSAMREVENGAQIVNTIREQSGIELQVINGKKEAEIIYSNHFEKSLDGARSYLYIDVGGGSTEITIFDKGKVHTSHSFNIGTVRLMENLVSDESWQEMKAWIKQKTRKLNSLVGIGSGGNINKIFDLARKKRGKPLKYGKIKKIARDVASHTYDERIQKLGLKPDRAEVIVPASRIYLSAMKWGKIKKMYVPQIGLADGIVTMLYEKHKQEKGT